jgi:protease I
MEQRMERQGTTRRKALLAGVKVAALVEEGFEEEELVGPRNLLEASGAHVDIVSPRRDKVRSWTRGNWGAQFAVDVPLNSADPAGYHALLLPGGVRNPDRLRRNEQAWRFVRAFFESGKPVAAICHAPWTLIDAGVIDGRRMTSYESLQTDLRNAGAEWVDREVVVDRGLVTSRGPRDIPAFTRAFVEEIAYSGAA